MSISVAHFSGKIVLKQNGYFTLKLVCDCIAFQPGDYTRTQLMRSDSHFNTLAVFILYIFAYVVSHAIARVVINIGGDQSILVFFLYQQAAYHILSLVECFML